MPFLPLDHPEPYSATLGVMLYPDEVDAPKARAYAAQYLASAFTRFREAGGILPNDVVAPVLMDAGQPLTDLEERWRGGRATGEAFKTFFALANTDPALASWNNAIKVAELIAKRFKVKGARTDLWDAKRRFLSVAHLWAARSIREGKSFVHLEVGYDASADFQSFLTEAEILRKWGQTWRPPRAKSEPPLPRNVWQVVRTENLIRIDWASDSPERHRRWPHCSALSWPFWPRPSSRRAGLKQRMRHSEIS
jgi:hypothetical protein